MTSLIRSLLSRQRGARARDEASASQEEIIVRAGAPSEKPFIACSIYYLAVVLFIGLPVWFYTCSSTRYSLPSLDKLDNKLAGSHPRLHLDISVVQLTATNHHDANKLSQADYLRAHLPDYLNTSIENVTYSLNWRIRRPTAEETQLLRSLMKEDENSTSPDEIKRKTFAKLENLLKIHKPSNRFRLFMFLFEEPLNSLICDRPQTYLIDFERFVYLCPGDGNESLVNLIQSVLDEVYYKTVDINRVKKILSGKTDLLVSLVPENGPNDVENLSLLADKVHKIYEKNVRNRYLELAEVLNIRLFTQNIIDLLNGRVIEKMLKKGSLNNTNDANSTDIFTSDRVFKTEVMGQFFHSFESRLSKHSSQSVHHVLTIVPDSNKPKLVFREASHDSVHLLEERDSNFILIADHDRSLVLGLRAIVRRIVGLSAANLCTNCQVRRDVFINSWELDAIIGALTIVKLENILISLRSISQQAIGIKIPKYVSSMAREARDLALKSLDNLETKKPLEAYRLANSAFELSEAAFYDPSLLETLYFPEETKYAIYLPLFLPLAFPFVMSILRTLKYVVNWRSAPLEKRKIN